MSEKVVVALDWTPNTNHIGFYVAKARGLYAAAGLDVAIRSPHVDEYHVTPASLLATGEATFAVTPTETVISYNTWPEPDKKPKIKAVAALLQQDTSAVVALKSSGIARPRDLDGKVYASYGARYEGRIVQSLIRADGGSGEYVEKAVPMLGIWNTLLQDTADATWVFMGWEGVEAEQKGVELNVFKLQDYGIPYAPCPLLVAHPDTVNSKADMARRFLAATEAGYQAAAADPQAAAADFLAAVATEHAAQPLSPPLDAALVEASALRLAKEYLTAGGRWGVMETGRWDAFLDWLAENNLLTSKVQSRTPAGETSTSLDGLRSGDAGEPVDRAAVQSAALFTNDLLPL